MSHQGIHSTLSVGDVHSLSNCWTYTVIAGAWNMTKVVDDNWHHKSFLALHQCLHAIILYFALSQGSSQSHSSVRLLLT
jgi:hypothetical protein